MSSTLPIVGACLCAAVTFDVLPPYRWFSHCHCSLCRKQHGTLFGTGVGVLRERFRWLSGANSIGRYRVTAAFERPFCRVCGASVPAVSHDSRTYHVPAGLLTGELGARPRSHIFVASKSPLYALRDSLPQHAAYPPGFELAVENTPRPPPSAEPLHGSCSCGAIAFAAEEMPRRLFNCYCSLCRRSRGGAFASTLFVARSRFRWLRGERHVRSYALPAPGRYRTDFCGDCGSIVPTAVPEVARAAVPAGAIDTNLAPLPVVHVCVQSKASWYEITDAGPQFAELPHPEERAEVRD